MGYADQKIDSPAHSKEESIRELILPLFNLPDLSSSLRTTIFRVYKTHLWTFKYWSPGKLTSNPEVHDSDQDSDAYIFGDLAHPPRIYGPLDILSAGFNVCNSWAGVAASMFLAIFQGGPVTIIYGCILMLFLMGATALSLAELSARYPTAGGQYHWTAILAPKKISRGLVCFAGFVREN